MVEEIELDELRRHLTKAVEEQMDESDYVSEEEVRDIVEQIVPDEYHEDEEDDESPDEVEEKAFSEEDLREQLPDDIYDAVMRHLEQPDSSFEKALKAISGEGPDIPVVESDTSPAEAAEVARKRVYDADSSPGR